MTAKILRADDAAGRPYVPGLVIGDLIFVSGQIPQRDGRIVDGPIESQVQVVLGNIESILQDAGASLRDVARCGVFVADLDDLPEVNRASEQAFGGLSRRERPSARRCPATASRSTASPSSQGPTASPRRRWLLAGRPRAVSDLMVADSARGCHDPHPGQPARRGRSGIDMTDQLRRLA
ncbi:MAG: RidA family protein, partial [Acidimicrobiales bacterium]